jgi:CHAD domain-containing protein
MAVIRRSHDPEVVHDLRVAIRRFAQSLVVFKSCFGRKEQKRIRRSLRTIMGAAGEVRDCDIALNFISELRPQDARDLETKVLVRRKAADDGLHAEVHRQLARNWSSKWRSMLEAKPKDCGACHQRVDPVATNELARMAAKFFSSGNRAAIAKASEDEVHQFRIAAKKFRYALELFAQLYGSEVNQWLENIARVQSLLGVANDCRVVRTMVSQIGGYRGFEAVLEKNQRRKMERFRRLWADEFAQPIAVRQWLRALRLPPKKGPARSQSFDSGRQLAGAWSDR